MTLKTTMMLAVISAWPAMAAVIPAELPRASHKAPTKDKPVKVYILSGQSNCLGFGRVEGAAPLYQRVFLSADPSARDCQLPVKGTAMMTVGVFQSADADAPAGAVARVYSGAWSRKWKPGEPSKVEAFALGETSATIPSIDGPQVVVAEGFIESPLGGVFQVRAGQDSSSRCIVEVDGVVAYRKTNGAVPALTGVPLKKGQRHAIKITYLAGGSAALYFEQTDLKGMGDLRWLVDDLGKYGHLLKHDGDWFERRDVVLCDAYMGKGKSDPLSAKAVGPTFGPELGFGWVMGEFHDEPVIVMKADIGNRSLGWDILPPGTESWEHDGKMNPGYGLTLDENGQPVKPKEGQWYAGKQYDDYTASIHAVLDNFKEKYPEFADQGFEVAGFVWWQGHKDGPNPAHNSRYEQNLVNLIKAWRKEFNAPHATWAIATVAFDGPNMPEHYQQIAQAQKNVADPNRHPELAGTVKTIDAVPFWRPAGMSPKNQNYHYNHNAETYLLVGDALGRAMVELKGGEVEYPSGAIDDSIDFIPDLPGVRGDEVSAMQSALKPIMLDLLIPEFAEKADKVPSYLRHGLPFETILKQQQPKGRKKGEMAYNLSSQLDKMIEFYEFAGVRDYSWTPLDESSLEADWQFASFDAPAGSAPVVKAVMYREIVLPKGMAGWETPAFDPAAAGWKTGKAPFGQKDGELQALLEGCRVSHCRCNMMPNTLWEKDVLLMRRGFQMPDFNDKTRRYRLVVGGAGHGWSGEGYALYIDGELVSEMTGGYYKGGGDARGVFLFDAMQEKFAGKEVTVAIKAFLRRSGHKGKEAPPVGHLNAWIESAVLPPTALGMITE